MSDPGAAEIARGDNVRVLAGRFEGRKGVVVRVLNEGGPGTLVQVAFPEGATDYCLASNLERIEGSDSPRAGEKGGKK